MGADASAGAEWTWEPQTERQRVGFDGEGTVIKAQGIEASLRTRNEMVNVISIDR